MHSHPARPDRRDFLRAGGFWGAASALGAANETLDACTAATQAANRAANLAQKKEERRLLMRLLREAAYQTRTADTLLDQLSGVWAEVPVEAVRLNRDSLTLHVGDRAALGVRISPEDATEQTVLWESSDETVATVSITVPAQQIPAEQAAVLVPLVMNAAAQLTARISHLPARAWPKMHEKIAA